MISLWVKERLRDILITKTRASKIRYNRKLLLDENSDGSLTVRDAVQADKNMISSIAVFAKDTHIYVPSSRYYVNMSHPPFRKTFSPPVGTWKIEWKIGSGTGVQFGKGS
jgi:hypothetical protein